MKDLSFLFQRDFKKLEECIAKYQNDEELWVKKKDIPNSGGNLCLHLCGNLNYYIGSVLGKTGYIRNREGEFTDSGMTRADLIILVQKTADQVAKTLEHLDTQNEIIDYPLPFRGEIWSTKKFLLHLYGHFNYHLGQLDYHRRGVI